MDSRFDIVLVRQIVAPAIFICLAMTFSKINPPVAQMPPMEIHPWLLTRQKMQDNHLCVFFRSVFTVSRRYNGLLGTSLKRSLYPKSVISKLGYGRLLYVRVIDFYGPRIWVHRSSWAFIVFLLNVVRFLQY